MSKIIAYLTAETGLPASDIRAIINQAPVSYKRYTIAKRTGGRRPIAQPAREVKALQRLLVAYLGHLPTHQAATAYKKQASIRINAERHASNGPIMKFDFLNFFTSLTERDWQAYCRKNDVFETGEDVSLSSKLFFHKIASSTILRLAIGAPSSPWLSNVLLDDFDGRISKAVARDKVVYTRYADDITFSAPRTGYLNQVEKTLRKVMAGLENPRLTLNEAKTTLATKKYRRVVTGLVIANDGRVTIGRERKRVIRAALDRASKGALDMEDRSKLAGWIAFAKGVEPEYFARLTERYGEDIVAKLTSPMVITL